MLIKWSIIDITMVVGTIASLKYSPTLTVSAEMKPKGIEYCGPEVHLVTGAGN